MESRDGEHLVGRRCRMADLVVLLVVKIKLTKYIVLVVMGPLLAAVSEAVETQITGASVSFSWGRWTKDAVRGLRSAALLATFEWSLTLMLWAVGLAVPVLSPFTLSLAWTLGAWAYGASVMDYVWEREGKALGLVGGFLAAVWVGLECGHSLCPLDVRACVGVDRGAIDGRDGGHRHGVCCA